jgi:hypothetical protein
VAPTVANVKKSRRVTGAREILFCPATFPLPPE